MCGGPLSRYTCHTRFPQNLRGFLGAAAVSRYTPPNSPAAPVALQLQGVPHLKLPLKRCRATRGCSSYTCGCRATLCNYALWLFPDFAGFGVSKLSTPLPCPSFPCFFGKRPGKRSKKQGFLSLLKPLKIPGKEGKIAQKPRCEMATIRSKIFVIKKKIVGKLISDC